MDGVIVKPDGSPYEIETEQDKCPHESTQEIQGAGPCPLRVVCVDCKEEL